MKHKCPKCGSTRTEHVGCVFYTYSRQCKDCGWVFPEPEGKNVGFTEDSELIKKLKEVSDNVEVLSQDEFFRKEGIE